jgi:hypothetical protein
LTAAGRFGERRPMLEFVLFLVFWFVLVNFIFPRMGLKPG